MTFFGWYDDNPKKPLATKLSEASEAYKERFGTAPNVALINESEAVAAAGVALPGLVVQVKPFLRRYNYWLGWHQ